MLCKEQHLSDDELLLMEDGELSPRCLAYARRHVTSCARCAGRKAELGAVIVDFTRAYRDSWVASPPARGSRARLQAELEAQTERESAIARWWCLPELPAKTGWAFAAMVVVAMLSWQLADWVGPHPRSAHGSPAATGPVLPRPDLTPGAVRQVTVREVCGHEPSLSGTVVAASVPRQVFEAYGVDHRRAEEYELDFLITPELGGMPDALNLWPQPYRSTMWNAYVKDELERHFQRMVCEGTVDMATAQRELATDWISAYKRYFNAERPLRDYGRFPLTALDTEALQSEAAEKRLLPSPRSVSRVTKRALPPWHRIVRSPLSVFGKDDRVVGAPDHS